MSELETEIKSESKDFVPREFYPVAEPVVGELEAEYVADAVRSGWVSSLGYYITQFEAEFAAYCDATYGMTTSNGTTALHLALHCLGIGPGDEVIVPSLTFVASANAVAYTGATPVFADVDPENWCLDPLAVQRALTPRTRAVIAVHLYGHPADMDALKAACGPDIPIIEDAAEAHGALYKGKRVGNLGAAGVFSFYGNKTITMGEGGIILTDDEKLAERARFLRDHGMSKERRYWHPEIGFNYRITNIQAALGVAQMQRIEEILQRKRDIFCWYQEGLALARPDTDRQELILNPQMEWAQSSFWLSCVLLPDGVDQNETMVRLRERGIDSRPFFHPMHTLPPYQAMRAVGAQGDGCPVAERLARQGINVPSGVVLEREDVLHISHHLHEIVDELRAASA